MPPTSKDDPHTISFVVEDTGDGEIDTYEESLWVVNGMVFRPPFSMPYTKVKTPGDNEHNQANCDEQTGFSSAYAASFGSGDGATAGPIIRFDVEDETYVKWYVEIASHHQVGTAGYSILNGNEVDLAIFFDNEKNSILPYYGI